MYTNRKYIIKEGPKLLTASKSCLRLYQVVALKILKLKINLYSTKILLPKIPVGDIVYMGPVTLNKDSSINKAGVEVNVIPIMKSPCPSPQPQRKHVYRRPHSEMGFRRDKFDQDDSGSLPDLKRSSNKGSLLDTVLRMNPETFLSTDSLNTDSRLSKSSGSLIAVSKGAIMTAVVDWLHKTSPFGSVDQLDQRSYATSIADITDTSYSVFDDDDFEEKSISKSETTIPEIFILPDDNTTTLSPAKKRIKKSKTGSQLGKYIPIKK